jgi:integrase
MSACNKHNTEKFINKWVFSTFGMEQEQTYRDFDHDLEMEFRRLETDKNFTDKDKQLVKEFIRDCQAENKSPARNIFYLHHLRMIKKILKKDFTKADKKEVIKDFMLEAQKYRYEKKKGEERRLSDWTLQNYKITLKFFYKWLHQTKYKKRFSKYEYPESVAWISTTHKNRNHKLPEDVITEDDVKQILEACDNARDKALISLLWDSGCRIGEALSLRLKHLTFDRYGGVIVVHGKTEMRRVRLIPSIPYLANWKEHHPRKDDPNAPLFIGLGSRNHHKQLKYNAIDRLFRKLKEKTNFKKRLHAHAFRHARATFYAPKLKESIMKEFFGWTKSSNMTEIYTHLSGRDIDKEIRKAHGLIEEQEKEESKLAPKACPRCNKQNEATAKFCSSCSLILDQKTAIRIDKEMEFANQVMNTYYEKRTKKQISPQQDFKTALKEIIKEVIKDEIKT